MANDAPDWQQLVQFPSAQQINISEVTAASLPANVINAYLSAFGALTVGAQTMNVNNLAPNASAGHLVNNIPVNCYDEAIFILDSANGDLQNYTIQLSQQRYQTQVSGATYITPSSNTITEKLNAVFDSNTGHFVSNPISLDPTFPMNEIFLSFVNNSASAITDTVTITTILKYSSDVITNPNTNPVQIQGIHGNNSSSGSMTLPSNTATMIPGSANTVVTRLIVTPYNQNGAALNALDRIFVMINGAIAAAIPIGGLAAGTFGQPVEFDFGDGIALGANGIQLNPNDSVQGYATIVTK